VSLVLLFVDELRGFYKSKVMVFLWVGLPVIALLFHFISSATTSTLPFTVVSTIVVSSLGGTLASIMLAVSIVNEKNRHVYELFLIRPIRRRDIILAKFFSIYICVAIASSLAVITGVIADFVSGGALSGTVLNGAFQSFATSLSMIAVSCSAGILIGVASPSVLVGAILVLYGGNQISVIPLIPTFLNISNVVLFTATLAAIISIALLTLAIFTFERKQF
jgi:ABC-2 type transport system permease protein